MADPSRAAPSRTARPPFAELAAFAAGLAALAALAGWALDVDVLRRIVPGFEAMTVNTALGIGAAAAGLFLVARSARPSPLAALLGAATLVLALATLAQHAFGLRLGIDELLVPDLAMRAAGAAAPGRMSVATATGLAFAGAALVGQALHRRPLASQLLAIGAFGVGIVGLAGYLVNRAGLYAVAPFSSLALHTAGALFALGCGLVFARPGVGLARPLGGEFLGASFARRVLPLAVLLPLLFVGTVALAQRHSSVSASFALAIAATGSVLMLLALGWAAALAVERKELALRAERNELATLLRSIGDGVIVTAPDTTVRFLNPVAETLTGIRDADARGRPLREVFDLVAEDTGEPMPSPVREALRLGRTVNLQGPALLRARDGAEHPIDDSAAPVRAPDGRIEAVVLVFREISERRRHEREEAEAAAAKDRFLATLAHELRNPLSPVLAGAALLQDPTHSPEDARAAVRTIERQTLHMVRLIDDLLDVSRLTRDRLELQRAPAVLSDVIELAVETARPALEAADHALDVRIETGLPGLHADAARLSQVFSNLLINAARYTPPGGHVRLVAAREGELVRIDVADDGAGMEPSRLESVFGLYAQLEPGSVRGHMGLGIGLTLARAVTELHGGTLAAHSDGPGRGSTFSVRLPFARPTEVRPPDAASPDTAAPHPATVAGVRRVLVVDDHADAAQAVARLLAHRGYEVHVAGDAEDALREVDRALPDACVLDIGLPGMDGYELARRLRARDGGDALLLVALTGWGRSEDVGRANEAGFDHHLVKPVRAKALLAILEAVPAAA